MYLKMAVIFVCMVMVIADLKFASSNDNINYSFYEVTAYNYRERAFLYSMQTKSDKYIFMNGVSNEAAIPVDIIVNKCCIIFFEKELLSNNIDFTHISSNILWDKSKNMRQTISPPMMYNEIAIKLFYNLLKMQIWIEQKLKKHSTLTKIIIGNTYEHRDIMVLKMSAARKTCAILVIGGEEGRDWMSPTIILNFINNILEHKNLKQMTEYCDLYFLPVFNPDGYEYSIRKDIFWTKNRKVFSPRKMCNGTEAIGVNIDRNWFLFKSPNLQDDECRTIYTGEKPLTEQEPQALFHFVNSIADHLMMFINIRGFERLITVPYGYTSMYSNNHLILMEILSATCNKLYEKHNATYFYGNTASILWNSADWIKENLNVPVVLTVYMQYKDYVFPDEAHIQPLTDQFTTIMLETLPVANNIYGPLFNNAVACLLDVNSLFIVSLLACCTGSII